MTLTRRQLVAAIPAAAIAAGLPRGTRAEDGRKVVTFWFAQANSDGQAALHNDLVEAFNKAAMALGGTWSFGTKSCGMSKPDTVMDVMSVPTLGSAFTGSLVHLACGATLSIAKNSQNAEGAAAVFDFMLTRKFYEAMNRDWPGKWAIPVKDLPPEMLQGIGYPLFEKTIAGLHEAFSKGQYGFTTWTFWPGATNSYLIEGIEQVWLNKITTEAYLTRMQTLFSQESKEGKVPPLPPRTA